jgi:hypothetical protein
MLFARNGFDAHTAFDNHAKFVFGVADAPFAGRAAPKTAMKFLRRIGVLVRHPRTRDAGQDIFVRRIRRLSGLKPIKDDNPGMRTHALS